VTIVQTIIGDYNNSTVDCTVSSFFDFTFPAKVSHIYNNTINIYYLRIVLIVFVCLFFRLLACFFYMFYCFATDIGELKMYNNSLLTPT